MGAASIGRWLLRLAIAGALLVLAMWMVSNYTGWGPFAEQVSWRQETQRPTPTWDASSAVPLGCDSAKNLLQLTEAFHKDRDANRIRFLRFGSELRENMMTTSNPSLDALGEEIVEDMRSWQGSESETTYLKLTTGLETYILTCKDLGH